MSTPADIARAMALTAERLGPFDGRLKWYAEVGSTNDIAAAFAEQGAGEGLVVLADRQTTGRGRLGRQWVSPAGAGLYVSVLLRPSAPAIPLLTIAAGVAVADGIAAATGLGVHLKWPNDLHVEGRKLAGILAEGAPHHVVLGIGINVLPAAYPPEVARRATSIEGELGRPVDRGMVLAECLAALASRYRQIEEDPARLLTDWRRRARSTLGRRVECHVGDEPIVGIAEDIGEDGALLVRSATGVARVRSGEVRWL